MLLPRAATLAVLCGVLAGCSSAAPATSSCSSAALSSAAPTWTTVGFGVGGTSVGPGKNVLVVYGGYTASDADSRALALALNGSTSFRGLGIGSIYAARGPDTAGYTNRGIGNSEVVAAGSNRRRPRPTPSSSSRIRAARSSPTSCSPRRPTTSWRNRLLRARRRHVGAQRRAHRQDEGGLVRLREGLGGRRVGQRLVDDRANASAFWASHLFKVNADRSGCNVGAVWCLHDTLITTRPHNPSAYDPSTTTTPRSRARGATWSASYVNQGIAAGLLRPVQPHAAAERRRGDRCAAG